MSKHILVVDLPDDSKCFKCPHWIGYGADGCELVKQTDNGNRPSRPADCPLIPVERVIWKMNYLNDQENVTGSQATAWCEHVLRDELGVTE